MALIKCDECGQMVSDKAKSCPKCGNPYIQKTAPRTIENPKAKETNKNKKWLFALFGIIVITIIIAVGAFLLNPVFKSEMTSLVTELLEGDAVSVQPTASQGAELSDGDAKSVKSTAPNPPEAKSVPTPSDLEILGIEGKIKTFEFRPDADYSYDYYFNEQGMLESIRFSDMGYISICHFKNGKLFESDESHYDEVNDMYVKNGVYTYQYRNRSYYNDVIYKSGKVYAEIFYDTHKRIIKIIKEGKESTYSYDEDGKSYNQDKRIVLISAELAGMETELPSNYSDLPHCINLIPWE